MSAHGLPRITPEEYLEIERASHTRSEYYDGAMYAMSGGSSRHAILIGSFTRELGNALRKRRGIVIPSDLRVRVSPCSYVYPDVIVTYREQKYADDQSDILLNPSVVIEVLSPSTEAHDRGFKSKLYRAVESLQEYALVSQDEPRVEVFRRQPSGDWLLHESIGIDAVCRFDSIDCAVTLSDIYEKISFDSLG